ncbi:hypothetical protein S245_022311 [Arachis hypogaea]
MGGTWAGLLRCDFWSWSSEVDLFKVVGPMGGVGLFTLQWGSCGFILQVQSIDQKRWIWKRRTRTTNCRS